MKIAIRLYAPLVAGLYLLLVGLSVDEVGDTLTMSVNLVVVSVGGWPLPDWLGTPVQAWSRVVGLALVVYAAFADFSGFFPSRFKAEVFFDNDGIKQQLKQFTVKERESLTLSTASWDRVQEEYRQKFVSLLVARNEKGKVKKRHLKALKDNNTHGDGQVEITIAKRTMMSYVIEKSTGDLRIKAAIPRAELQRVITRFRLQQSPHNLIKFEIGNILKGITVLLTPRFEQVVESEGDLSTVPFDHGVVCVTKVRVLPAPWIGSTVYLLEVDEDGRTAHVPVGYARYKAAS